MQKTNKVKIQTYVPVDAIDRVRIAIGDAGAGVIGNYSHCAFVSSGHGYFLPLDGSNPTIGEKGTLEKVEEMKIEFVCEKEKVSEVVKALKEAHPYEEVPIEIFELLEY